MSTQKDDKTRRHINSPFLPPWPGEPDWYDDSKLNTLSKEVQDYIETRLKHFTRGLYEKANDHMARYYQLQISIIIVGALIPIVNVVTINDFFVRIISAILGGVIVACSGIIQLIKLRDSGIVFRIMSARLQKEYHSFIQKAGKYSKDEGRDNLFIQTCEDLIFHATTEYYDLFRESRKEDQNTNQTQSEK